MRVKDDDCDVPMLTMDDFEFCPLSPEVVSIVGNSEVLTNVNYQKELASMFIEKSKLCLIISRVLSAQYSVLSHKFGGTMETTMMLVPKKSAAETIEVCRCDQQLEDWLANLPSAIQYSPCMSFKLTEAEEVLHSHRALLKMTYLTASSALHRPQVLPAMPSPSVDAELQEASRKKVRFAAVEITNVAQDLHNLDLTRYLPTTGVTVILPAVIIHLLDIKASDPSVRMTSLNRFYQCMRILQRLREIYASADFATSFLEAAIRKAGIQVTLPPEEVPTRRPPPPPPQQPMNFDTAIRVSALTPPPDSLAQKLPDLTYPKPPVPMPQPAGETNVFFASTPPHSEGSENGSTNNINPDYKPDAFSIPNLDDTNLSLSELIDLANEAEVTQNDFDALINFDEAGADLFSADDGLGLNGGAPNGKNYGFDMGNNMADGLELDSKPVDFGGLGGGPPATDAAAQAEANPTPADLDTELGLGLDS